MTGQHLLLPLGISTIHYSCRLQRACSGKCLEFVLAGLAGQGDQATYNASFLQRHDTEYILPPRCFLHAATQFH